MGSRSLAAYFPRGMRPRPAQSTVLAHLEKGWNDYDVFVLRVPVGGGKSALARTISAGTAGLWGGGGRCFVAPPDNALLDQYTRQWPSWDVLHRADSYTCHSNGDAPISCRERAASYGRACLHPGGNYHHPGSCPLVKALRSSRSTKQLLANYHTLLGHRMAPNADVLVFDEAHRLVQLRRDLAATKLPCGEFRIPRDIWEPDQLAEWLYSRDGGLSSPGDPAKLQLLRDCYESASPRYLVSIETEDMRSGGERRVVKLTPIDVDGEPPTLWSGKSGDQKIVLMSATIFPYDLEQLGLAKRRILYVDVPSDIPVENRPLYYDPVVRMSAGRERTEMPVIADWLDYVAREAYVGARGVVHCPYRLVPLLLEALRGGPLADLVVSHDRRNKRQILEHFLEGSGPPILIACGMSEGVDFAGERATWQALIDAPWGSLGDPATAWLAREKPERYVGEAVRTLSQTYGRVSRGPVDFGATLVADSGAQPLLESEQAPIWLQEARR